MLSKAVRSEAVAWISLTGPFALVRFSELIPWLIQLTIVGRVGLRELAALSLIETWLYPWMICIWDSVCSAEATLVSQAHGAKGLHVARGWGALSLVFVALGSCVSTGAWLAGKPVLDALGFDPDLTSLAQSYTLWALPALWLEGFAVSVQAYLDGVQIVLPSLLVSLFACGVDIILCLTLVFGWGTIAAVSYDGMPNKLEALATSWSIASLVSLIGCAMLLRRYVGRELQFGHEKDASDADPAAPGEGDDVPAERAPLLVNASSANTDTTASPALVVPMDWRALRKFLCTRSRYKTYLGQALPAMLTSILANAQFTFMALIAASMGDVPLATHSVLACLFEITHTVGTSMSESTATRIGFHVGRGDITAAKCTMRIALTAGCAWGCVVAVLGLALRAYMGRIFTSDAAVVALAEQVAPWMWGGYAVLLAGDVAMGVLGGCGRAGMQGFAFVAGTWGVGLPLIVVSWRVTQWGLAGLWGTLILGYLVMATLAFVAVARTDWNQVIEDARVRAAEEKGEAADAEEGDEAGTE